MIKLYLITTLFILGYSCLKLYMGKFDDKKTETVDKDCKELLQRIGSKNFIRFVLVFSSIQLFFATINYTLFSFVVEYIYALVLFVVSFSMRLYMIKRSTNILRICLARHDKPISVWIRYNFLKRTFASNVLYLDTFIVFYTLLHM